MGLIQRDKIKPLGGDAFPQGIAFTVADKYDLPAFILPGLSQGQTAHDMAGTDLRCGISTDDQGIHVSRLKPEWAIGPLSLDIRLFDFKASAIMIKASRTAAR